MNRDAYRHYPNDNCGDPDHDRILEAWYARAEALLASQERPSIDVDILRDALRRVYKSRYHERFAEPLAAEYLRLSGPVGE